MQDGRTRQNIPLQSRLRASGSACLIENCHHTRDSIIHVYDGAGCDTAGRLGCSACIGLRHLNTQASADIALREVIKRSSRVRNRDAVPEPLVEQDPEPIVISKRAGGSRQPVPLLSAADTPRRIGCAADRWHAGHRIVHRNHVDRKCVGNESQIFPVVLRSAVVLHPELKRCQQIAIGVGGRREDKPAESGNGDRRSRSNSLRVEFKRAAPWKRDNLHRRKRVRRVVIGIAEPEIAQRECVGSVFAGGDRAVCSLRRMIIDSHLNRIDDCSGGIGIEAGAQTVPSDVAAKIIKAEAPHLTAGGIAEIGSIERQVRPDASLGKVTQPGDCIPVG